MTAPLPPVDGRGLAPTGSAAEGRRGSIDEDRPLSGEAFSKYVLVGEIAQGGMGEVFLAVQQGLEGFSKVVVVKRVLRHLTSNAELTRMFIDEARLAARLEHPNIVKTYEFGEHEGQYFTVMEFLAGEDLGKVLYNFSLRAELMPLPVALHLTAQLCNGLHFAHELTDRAGRPLRLVHRDINPANVVVTYTGEVKIIDFGVARVDTAAIKTATGMLKGKFAYMSPEYIQGQGCDQRADVFSVGIVLWEALTGRQLFARETTAATMYAVMDDPIPMPSRYRADVPPELDQIVARALARKPEERFASADEMRIALEELAGRLPKVDGRAIGRIMEDLFGPIRAQAMTAITQSRSLARNIALVMKRPAAIPVSRSPVGWQSTVAASPMPPAPRRRRWPLVVGALALVVLGGGIVALAMSGRGGTSAQPAVAIAPTSAALPVAAPVTPPPAVAPPVIPAETAPVPPPVTPAETAPIPPEVTAPIPPPVVAARGRLSITTRSNAVVYLDGKVFEHGSFADRPIASGKHQLVVRIPGRRPVARAISVVANQDTRLEIDVASQAASAAASTPDPLASSEPTSRPAPRDEPHGSAVPVEAPAHDPAPIVPAKPPVASKPPAGKPPVSKPEPATPPPAVVAPAVKQPSLDIAATRAAVRSQIAPIQQCYERAKMDDGNLRGNVTVRITIAPDGSVAGAQVASSTLGSPQAEGCITREISHWHLPRPSGGVAVSLSYPFVFE